MNRIGIVTIVSENYGNRLQNYALQTVLQNMGYTVNTIRRKKTSIVLVIKNYIHYLWNTNNATQFFKFNKNIVWSKKVWDEKSQLSDLNILYDYFITGSDQVWNPYYSFTGTELEFLTFVDCNRKISYAASFGVSSIPTDKLDEYKGFLKDFSKISTRENSGSDIIYTLTGRNVPVLLDPVLLLEAEQWRSISKRPRNLPESSYSLVYYVEKMSEPLRLAVEEEKKKKHVIEVRKINEMDRVVGPAEFLYLIDHADKLLTDSFHGMAFSILFHVPFCVYEREGNDMSSRMESLLTTLQLDAVTKFSENVFAKSDLVLKEKRKEAMIFLRNTLGE